jgi:hypothetical protein
LHAYDGFSGVGLSASYQEGSPDPAGQCVTTDNQTHITQGRAYRCGWWNACAVGSNDNLGWARSFVVSSLKEVSSDYWEETESCQ